MFELEKKTTIPVGTPVRLGSGEEGEVVCNDNPIKYEIKINGRDGTSLFEWKFVKELTEEQPREEQWITSFK